MLTLAEIDIHYGSTHAVKTASLALRKGQIGCLLGPSGCGKTSILRAVAGFEHISHGEILIDQNVMSTPGKMVPPEKRNVGIVFQDFALFPHLTVERNIAFGLLTGSPKKINARVDELLSLVDLTAHRDKYPHQLSGGQQQRVALARAMAPKPELLLLDEPFANLDADLREDLAAQVRQILKFENTTALLVTHDQQEAFAIADVIGAMQQGAIHQWGTAYDLYHRPVSKFVADFVGEGIFVAGHLDRAGLVNTPLGQFPLPQRYNYQGPMELEVLVRPDDVLHNDNSPLKTQVISKSFRGAHSLFQLRMLDQGAETLLCLAPSHHNHQAGEQFGIELDLEHIIVFPSTADNNEN